MFSKWVVIHEFIEPERTDLDDGDDYTESDTSFTESRSEAFTVTDGTNFRSFRKSRGEDTLINTQSF